MSIRTTGVIGASHSREASRAHTGLADASTREVKQRGWGGGVCLLLFMSRSFDHVLRFFIRIQQRVLPVRQELRWDETTPFRFTASHLRNKADESFDLLRRRENTLGVDKVIDSSNTSFPLYHDLIRGVVI